MTAVAMEGIFSSDPALEKENDARRPAFVLFTVGMLLVVNLSSSLIFSTQWWKSAVFAVALNLSIYACYIAYHRDWVLLRWMVVVTVAGVVELVADWWLVVHAGPESGGAFVDGILEVKGNLVYGIMPHIWRSPAYMPLAWAGVLIQIVALGYYFHGRMGMVKASLLTAVIGGVNIPIYEHIARGAEWWTYVQTTMLIKNAPWYIVIGEFLCCLPLVWIAVNARHAKPGRLVLYGVIAGASIFVAYYLAYYAVGRCDGPLSGFGQTLDIWHGCAVPRHTS